MGREHDASASKKSCHRNGQVTVGYGDRFQAGSKEAEFLELEE